jgi:hypothetical protein
MSTAKFVHLSIHIATDLAALIGSAAKANDVAVDEIVSDCIRQHFETALSHHRFTSDLEPTSPPRMSSANGNGHANSVPSASGRGTELILTHD